MGLQHELFQKVAWAKRMESMGKKHYHTRFLSAEGCYSYQAISAERSEGVASVDAARAAWPMGRHTRALCSLSRSSGHVARGARVAHVRDACLASYSSMTLTRWQALHTPALKVKVANKQFIGLDNKGGCKQGDSYSAASMMMATPAAARAFRQCTAATCVPAW